MLHRTSSLSVWRKQLPRGVESGLFTGVVGYGKKDNVEEGSILVG